MLMVRHPTELATVDPLQGLLAIRRVGRGVTNDIHRGVNLT